MSTTEKTTTIATAAIRPGDPVHVAWQKFRLSPEFQAAQQWNADPERHEAALLAMFAAGWQAAASPVSESDHRFADNETIERAGLSITRNDDGSITVNGARIDATEEGGNRNTHHALTKLASAMRQDETVAQSRENQENAQARGDEARELNQTETEQRRRESLDEQGRVAAQERKDHEKDKMGDNPEATRDIARQDANQRGAQLTESSRSIAEGERARMGDGQNLTGSDVVDESTRRRQERDNQDNRNVNKGGKKNR